MIPNLKKFKTWLTDCGAVLVDTTNPWEVLRFKTINGTSVIYRNKYDELTFTGESEDAHAAWSKGKRWKAVDTKRQQLTMRKSKLAARDGKRCFFCWIRMGLDLLTIEHLVAKAHGGPDHDDNLCLSCQTCNLKVGKWPVTKKMQYRDEMRKVSTKNIIGGTALEIYETYMDRIDQLEKLKLLRPTSYAIELRRVVETVGEVKVT